MQCWQGLSWNQQDGRSCARRDPLSRAASGGRVGDTGRMCGKFPIRYTFILLAPAECLLLRNVLWHPKGGRMTPASPSRGRCFAGMGRVRPPVPLSGRGQAQRLSGLGPRGTSRGSNSTTAESISATGIPISSTKQSACCSNGACAHGLSVPSFRAVTFQFSPCCARYGRPSGAEISFTVRRVERGCRVRSTMLLIDPFFAV
jgi:hypothetical protein